MSAQMRPARAVSVALVAVWRTNTETQVNLSSDDFDYCSIIVYPAGGLEFWAGQAPVHNVPLANGDVVEAVCTYNAVGAWEVSYRINWGAVVTASGTANAPTLPLGLLESLTVRHAATPNLGELCRWQCQNKALTAPERLALLDAMAAIWQP